MVTARSMRAASVVMPRWASPARRAANSSAAWMIAFDGMQPTLRHVPPISARSTITVFNPSWAARSAADVAARAGADDQDVAVDRHALGPVRRTAGAGRLQQRLDPLDERGRVPAVDDAVVEARRQVHHRARLELPAVPHRAHLHLVDPDDGDLGVVDDRRGDQAAERAERRDRDRRAAELVARRLAVAGRGADPVDLGRARPQVERVGVAHHRDEQAVVGLGGDADVDRAVDGERARPRRRTSR